MCKTMFKVKHNFGYGHFEHQNGCPLGVAQLVVMQSFWKVRSGSISAVTTDQDSNVVIPMHRTESTVWSAQQSLELKKH